jgi:hypothetical protein
MSGHQPFETLRAQMTPERRAQNAAHTRALLAALPQQALQHAQAQALAELAQAFQGPEAPSPALAHQTDVYLSALRRCIEALGGRLEIVAHFPDGCVTITQLSAAGAPID